MVAARRIPWSSMAWALRWPLMEKRPSLSSIWQAVPGPGRCPAAGPLLLEQHHGNGAEGRGRWNRWQARAWW
jgi:hypothetical protein